MIGGPAFVGLSFASYHLVGASLAAPHRRPRGGRHRRGRHVRGRRHDGDRPVTRAPPGRGPQLLVRSDLRRPGLRPRPGRGGAGRGPRLRPGVDDGRRPVLHRRRAGPVHPRDAGAGRRRAWSGPGRRCCTAAALLPGLRALPVPRRSGRVHRRWSRCTCPTSACPTRRSVFLRLRRHACSPCGSSAPASPTASAPCGRPPRPRWSVPPVWSSWPAVARPVGLYAGTVVFALGMSLLFPAITTLSLAGVPGHERGSVVGHGVDVLRRLPGRRRAPAGRPRRPDRPPRRLRRRRRVVPRRPACSCAPVCDHAPAPADDDAVPAAVAASDCGHL